jgi:hypothetical protein
VQDQAGEKRRGDRQRPRRELVRASVFSGVASGSARATPPAASTSAATDRVKRLRETAAVTLPG